jgi:hypothetical protein
MSFGPLAESAILILIDNNFKVATDQVKPEQNHIDILRKRGSKHRNHRKNVDFTRLQAMIRSDELT